MATDDRKGRTIPIYADDELLLLAEQFQIAKKNGLTYKGKDGKTKPVSYPAALKLGIQIYLGIEDKDLDKLQKSKEEHLKQIRALQEMVKLEDQQIIEIQENNRAAIADTERKQTAIEKLAQFIEANWYGLTEDNYKSLKFRHICESLPEYDLTPEVVANFFPAKFNPMPTAEGYKVLAGRILEAGEGEGEQ